MILRNVVRDQIAMFFRSEQWRETMNVLDRGRSVDHAHVYCESILHPSAVARFIAEYFSAIGKPLERKVKILSHGPGFGNVYYVQPMGMCHFEIFLRYNPDLVIAPMRLNSTLSGKSVEYWDAAFMRRYYEQFDFRPFGEDEARAVEAYFASNAWKQIYGTMFYENERSVHSHCIIETNLHPEKILPIGCRAIESRGWRMDRAVSIVFNVNGLDQGKITYLVAKPEVVLELEWEFNPAVTIAPAVVPLARITTTDMVERDLASLDYIHLNEDDYAWLATQYSLPAGNSG